MKPLLIYGASGHGSVVRSVAERSGYEVVGFVDDHPPAGLYDRLPVKKLDEWDSGLAIAIGIGDAKVRRTLTRLLGDRLAPALIHDKAFVDPSAKLGSGTVVMASAAISVNAVIGTGCIINTGATVDHDCTLGEFVHVCPGVNLAGNVLVGDGAWIGIGSAVIQGLTIGKRATVGAGSVVIEDVAADATVAGVPAKSLGPTR